MTSSRRFAFAAAGIGFGLILAAFVAGFLWLNGGMRVDIRNSTGETVTLTTVKGGWWPAFEMARTLPVDRVFHAEAFVDQRNEFPLVVSFRDKRGEHKVSCVLKRDGKRWCRFETVIAQDSKLVCFPCEPFL